jgi:hypothetical protein
MICPVRALVILGTTTEVLSFIYNKVSPFFFQREIFMKTSKTAKLVNALSKGENISVKQLRIGRGLPMCGPLLIVCVIRALIFV